MKAKSILLSKTFWANLATVLAMILDDQEALNIIPDVVEPYMVYVLGVVNVIIRYWTVQPVALKMPDGTTKRSSSR